MKRYKKVNAPAFLVFFVFFVAVLPARAFAGSVQITEIMYDVPGTDTGREWIEITNTGSGSVDVTGYKLFEANTNHGLTVLRGSGTLAAGQSALIIEDQAKFSADSSAYSGGLFKASFSLSNTGETLAVKDSSLTVVDSVSYTSSLGAAGDGNTLHRSGDSFVAAAPDPGVFQGANASSTASDTSQNANNNSATDSATNTSAAAAEDTSTATSTLSQTVTTPDAPPLTARITTAASVTVGAGSAFSGMAFTAKGDPVEGARYFWNFGDGVTLEGQKVFHTYMDPGKYALALSVASGYSTGMSYVTVQALPVQIVFSVEPNGSGVVTNQSAQSINVGLWSVGPQAGAFIIPENTLVLSKQSVHFSPSVMHFAAGTSSALYYPNGTRVAPASPLAQTLSVLGVSPAVSPVVVATTTAGISTGISGGVVGGVSGQAQTLLSALMVKPRAVAIRTRPPLSTSTALTASVGNALPSGLFVESTRLLESLVGLVFLIACGVAGAWYVGVPGRFNLAGPGVTPSSDLSVADFSLTDE